MGRRPAVVNHENFSLGRRKVRYRRGARRTAIRVMKLSRLVVATFDHRENFGGARPSGGISSTKCGNSRQRPSASPLRSPVTRSPACGIVRQRSSFQVRRLVLPDEVLGCQKVSWVGRLRASATSSLIHQVGSLNPSVWSRSHSSVDFCRASAVLTARNVGSVARAVANSARRGLSRSRQAATCSWSSSVAVRTTLWICHRLSGCSWRCARPGTCWAAPVRRWVGARGETPELPPVGRPAP